MFSNQNSTPVAASFSKLLSHAVLDFYKDVQIIADWVDGALFCGEYLLGEQCQNIDLDALENRVIELQNQNIKFNLMEMVPVSAHGLFASNGQWHLQKEAESAQTTLNIVQMGPYYDFNRHGLDLDYASGCCKLLSAQLVVRGKETLLTIRGVAAKDKKTLKEQIKREKILEKTRHDRQVPSIFSQGVLLEEGTQLLDRLKNEFEKTFFEFGFDKVTMLDPDQNHFSALKKLALKTLNSKFYTWSTKEHDSRNPLKYGLFKLKNTLSLPLSMHLDQANLQKECISCLKFYDQIIKILGFSYLVRYQCGLSEDLGKVVSSAVELLNAEKIELKGKRPRVQLDVVDKLNRVVFSPSLEIEKRGKGHYLVSGLLCDSLEAVLGQALEQPSDHKSFVDQAVNAK